VGTGWVRAKAKGVRLRAAFGWLGLRLAPSTGQVQITSVPASSCALPEKEAPAVPGQRLVRVWISDIEHLVAASLPGLSS
jgi:hypothetical protein